MKKVDTIEGPLKIGDITLVVVVKTLLNGRCGRKSAWLFGMKRPIALIFKSGSSQRVFKISGVEISIEQLLEENSEISLDF